MAAEPIEPENNGEACLELNCSSYLLKPASINFGPTGARYRVRCGPLNAADQAALEHAAATGMSLKLVFADGQRLRLSPASVETIAVGWAWIEGTIVEDHR